MIDMDKAKQAKAELKNLTGVFNDLRNSIGIGMNGADYCVSVGLVREPTEQEKQSLPQEHNGVKIKYQVIGEIRPL